MDRLLLDSHIFLWAISGDKRLGKSASHLIRTTPMLYVSTLSLFELKAKQVRKKLTLPPELSKVASEWGIIMFDLTAAQLTNYAIYDDSNTDPFYNCLLTIAEQEHMRFITVDRKILTLQKYYDWIVDGR